MSPGLYSALADAVLFFHALIVLFVVAGQAFVLLGWAQRWTSARRPGFRYLHLMVVVVVVGLSWMGQDCPLTIWEHELRLSAGQPGYERGLIADLVQRTLFYQAPAWVFVVIYSAFLALVLLSWWRFSPRPSP